MSQPPRVVPVSQIIFRETDDGRVECAVIHRGKGLPLALARMLVAALGGVADVRDLGQQLSEGQTQAVSLLTIHDDRPHGPHLDTPRYTLGLSGVRGPGLPLPKPKAKA